MPTATQNFISRWQESDAAERANYQSFLSELCDFIGVDRPEPSQGIEDFNTYVFDKTIEVHHLDGTVARGWIGLYKKTTSFWKPSRAASRSSSR